jgi:rhodanese-related sulfurtransferase
MRKYPVYSGLFVLLMATLLLGFPAGNKARENLKLCNQNVITLEEFQRLRQEDKAPILVVDARTQENFSQGHIPQAINIPTDKLKQPAFQDKLPKDKKKTLIIFYCAGPQCSAACKAAIQAKNLGYEEFRIYGGGYPEWVQKGLPIER